jgi:copper transport protein
VRAPTRLAVHVGAVVALLLGASLAMPVPRAAAHALLIRATPAVNGTVASSPRQLLLTFTEPVDPTLSHVQVVDTQGRPVPGVSPSVAVAGNSQQLRVPLTRVLPHGVYTVDWQTVSALDGHLAGGAYAFGVGVANVATVAPFGKYVRTSSWLTDAAAAGRWLLWTGLVLLLGAACVCLVVWRGSLPARGGALLWCAWLLAAVGVSTVILTERAIVRAPSLLPLFETHEGMVLLGQGAAVLVACGLATYAVTALPGRITLAALGGAVALAMLSVVWGSHAGGVSAFRPLNLALQWLHVVAVGAWIGGLAWLLLGLRGLGRSDRAAAARRFSVVATVGLAVVLFTGLPRAVAEVGAPANLLHTSFGAFLLIKLGLFCVLVALGALNHFVLVPAQARGDAAAPFRRTLRSELVLGVGILAVTGVLGGLAPATFGAAAAKATASSQVVLTGSDYAATVRVRLVVSPGTVGSNQFTATVNNDATGRPLTGVRSVTLNFSLPGQAVVQSSTLALSGGPGGIWQGTGLELSVSGRWNIQVLVEQSTTAVEVPLVIDVARSGR